MSTHQSSPNLRRACLRGLLGVLLLSGSPAYADDIAPGHDLLNVLPGSSHTFAGPYEVPLDFFAPGSDPFTGTIALQPAPLGPLPTCPETFSNVGVVVRRPTVAQLPAPPSTVTIPIELVALSLVSVNPITVTYSGGQTPEPWNVRMNLSNIVPPQGGGATIQHGQSNGGTFTAQFPVVARFEFTKVQPQPEPPRVLDMGTIPSFFDVFVEVDIPWSHTGPSSLLPSSCASNIRPTVANGTTLAPALLAGSNTALRVQWPEGGAVAVERTPWGQLKRIYR
jgi:hypothetical protein